MSRLITSRLAFDDRSNQEEPEGDGPNKRKQKIYFINFGMLIVGGIQGRGGRI